jgi:hypothetical protein
MIVVMTPGGIATSRSSMTIRPPYPTVTPLAVSRAVLSAAGSTSVMC